MFLTARQSNSARLSSNRVGVEKIDLRFNRGFDCLSGSLEQDEKGLILTLKSGSHGRGDGPKFARLDTEELRRLNGRDLTQTRDLGHAELVSESNNLRGLGSRSTTDT